MGLHRCMQMREDDGRLVHKGNTHESRLQSPTGTERILQGQDCKASSRHEDEHESLRGSSEQRPQSALLNLFF